jgi:predicted nucleotidyltransferase
VDLTSPLATVTPTLDAGVLQVLTATRSSITTGEVHRRLGRGSDEGVRKVLARLVAQGVVVMEGPSRHPLYRFNRDHVAAEHIRGLAMVRSEIIRRIGAELDTWSVAAVHAGLFGSFARGEADSDSDIDVLLVHPALANPDTEDAWATQLGELEARVRAWTGNRAQLVAVSTEALAAMAAAKDPLLGSWRADMVHVRGQRLSDLLRRPR